MLKSIFKWSNDNQGVLSIVIFAVTLAFGWGSGIFRTLRQKPKFKIKMFPGPTFCCTYLVGEKYGEFDVHRTAFALYLHVANIGSAASSIEQISIGYHWDIKPFSKLWLKYGIGWFWIHEQTTALMDFHAKIGENIKGYPFLTQKSILTGDTPKTFLEIGRSTGGVVYFEQDDSYGGCYPVAKNSKVRIKIKVRDVFGKFHQEKLDIPSVSIEEARKYNPDFGKTYAELRGKPLPVDIKPDPVNGEVVSEQHQA